MLSNLNQSSDNTKELMMKHSKLLYVFITILGIVFLAPLFSTILQGGIDAAIIMMVIFLSITGTVFLAIGIRGIGSQYLRNNQNLSTTQPKLAKNSTRHFKLYKIIIVLGIVFLGTFFTIMHYINGHSAELYRFFSSTPIAGFLIFILFLFGGTGFVTVGICGIGRQYFKNKSLFAMLAAISIPLLILMPFFYVWFIPLSEPTFPMNTNGLTVTNATFSTVSGNNSVITLSIENNCDASFVLRVAKVNGDYYEITGTNVTIAERASGTVEITLTAGNYWITGKDYKMDIYDSNNIDRKHLVGYQATATATIEPTPSPKPEPFPTTLALASVVTITVIATGILVYFKKYRK